MTAAVGGRQPAAGKRTSGWAGPLYRPAAFRGTGPQNLGGRATRGRAGGIRAAGAGTLIGNLSRQDRRQTNRYKYRFGAKSTTPVSRRSRSLPELSHLVGGQHAAEVGQGVATATSRWAHPRRHGPRRLVGVVELACRAERAPALLVVMWAIRYLNQCRLRRYAADGRRNQERTDREGIADTIQCSIPK